MITTATIDCSENATTLTWSDDRKETLDVRRLRYELQSRGLQADQWDKVNAAQRGLRAVDLTFEVAEPDRQSDAPRTKEERLKAIIDELGDLHKRDLQISQYRDVNSNEPLVPIPLTALTEMDKRSQRRGELHKELYKLALENWAPES